MAVTPRLDLRQSQSLVMTPQLQQAIKLLQLNNLELAAYIETEREQNPLLIRDEPGEGGGADDAAAAEPAPEGIQDDEPYVPDSAELAEGEALAAGKEAALDLDYASDWDAASRDQMTA